MPVKLQFLYKGSDKTDSWQANSLIYLAMFSLWHSFLQKIFQPTFSFRLNNEKIGKI